MGSRRKGVVLCVPGVHRATPLDQIRSICQVVRGVRQSQGLEDVLYSFSLAQDHMRRQALTLAPLIEIHPNSSL